MKQKLTLKQARRRQRPGFPKGYTLEDLATRVGVDQSTLSRVERGIQRPLYQTVVAIQKVLGAVDFG